MFLHEYIYTRTPTLKEYSIFVASVRKYIEEASAAHNHDGILNLDNNQRNAIIEKAVSDAIDECIKNDVLKDFFIEYRKEVIEMGALGYSAQRHLQVVVEEANEIGVQQGIQQGIHQGIHQGVDVINKLNQKLYELGRKDDIVEAALNPEYQKKLIRELIDPDYEG